MISAGCLEGPFQRAIHTFKYRSRPDLGDRLASHLAGAVQEASLPLVSLAFVPLHPQRARQRGFNQAERLARSLGKALELPVQDGLSRIRATGPQVGLAGREREANVAGAFSWVGRGTPPAVTGLVDDVCTTGATLLEAARALNTAGGSVGAFLVLAVAHTLPAPVVTLPE
ncbi:MAG TPA: ComF family protein [Candidatus Dormibacteraeota bacterium]